MGQNARAVDLNILRSMKLWPLLLLAWQIFRYFYFARTFRLPV